MDVQSSEQGNIIEVRTDAGRERWAGGIKACEGAICGFSDAKTKDAQERSASMRKLLIAVALCIIFMGVEVVGGIKANSLAILTDAAHLLSDVASFAISLFSLWAAGWEATPRQSYGFFRIEILGALVSIQLIWLLTGILVYEAIDRIVHNTGEVQGFLMFLVATFGLLVNVIMAILLGHDHGHGHSHDHGDDDDHGHGHGHTHDQGEDDGHSHHHTEIHARDPLPDHGHDIKHDLGGDGHQGLEDGHVSTHSLTISSTYHHHHHHHHHHGSGHKSAVDTQPMLDKSSEAMLKSGQRPEKTKRRNINVQGAYLHVLGDSIQSVGVMVGGGIIWYRPEWKIVDLVCTLVFSVIVLATTIRMLRNILEVLMESTPREIDATRLEKGLCEMEEVVAIHELHIWAITVGKVLLACHVRIKPEADADMVLDKVVDYIRREYNISHVTIQIEREHSSSPSSS